MENECPVCFLDNWMMKTPCSHAICLDCLLKLRKDECPSCRKPLLYSLPREIKSIVTMYKPPKVSRILNINDRDEFPMLS